MPGDPEPILYSTSKQGPRARLASKVGTRSRRRRHERIFSLTGVDGDSRIVDIGCAHLGLRALAPELDVTGVDINPAPDYPGPFVQADATAELPFDDDEFDLAYSSSLIEHLAPEHRQTFAAEVKRVARGWYVQTPAYSFPIEPHALLPFAHWLPVPLRRQYWRLGASGFWEEIHMLRRREMEALFGPPVAERLGPLVKSWVSVKPVT